MKDEEIRFMECLSMKANLTLEDFCEKLSKDMDLPRFEYDAENESEWGWVQIDNIEINVSRPYELGKLQEWDDTTPENCNFGILLVVSNSAPLAWNLEWSYEVLVPEYAQRIANVIGSNVYYHRTWAATGKNIRRNLVYTPTNA